HDTTSRSPTRSNGSSPATTSTASSNDSTPPATPPHLPRDGTCERNHLVAPSASSVVCLAGCKSSHACVLSRPRTFGYAASLRPWPARFSPAMARTNLRREPLAANRLLDPGHQPVVRIEPALVRGPPAVDRLVVDREYARPRRILRRV